MAETERAISLAGMTLNGMRREIEVADWLDAAIFSLRWSGAGDGINPAHRGWVYEKPSLRLG